MRKMHLGFASSHDRVRAYLYGPTATSEERCTEEGEAISRQRNEKELARVGRVKGGEDEDERTEVISITVVVVNCFEWCECQQSIIASFLGFCVVTLLVVLLICCHLLLLVRCYAALHIFEGCSDLFFVP